MTAAAILRAARALYESAPSHAPTGAYPPPGEYCLMGALSKGAQRPTGDGPVRELRAACVAMYSAIGTTESVAWNAEHTTAEVLAAFDRAIEAVS
jgi:hypothetical protein